MNGINNKLDTAEHKIGKLKERLIENIQMRHRKKKIIGKKYTYIWKNKYVGNYKWILTIQNNCKFLWNLKYINN